MDHVLGRRPGTSAGSGERRSCADERQPEKRPVNEWARASPYIRVVMVDVPRFELGASSMPRKRASKLRHTPNM